VWGLIISVNIRSSNKSIFRSTILFNNAWISFRPIIKCKLKARKKKRWKILIGRDLLPFASAVDRTKHNGSNQFINIDCRLFYCVVISQNPFTQMTYHLVYNTFLLFSKFKQFRHQLNNRNYNIHMCVCVYANNNIIKCLSSCAVGLLVYVSKYVNVWDVFMNLFLILGSFTSVVVICD